MKSLKIKITSRIFLGLSLIILLLPPLILEATVDVAPPWIVPPRLQELSESLNKPVLNEPDALSGTGEGEEGAWYPSDFDLIKYLNNNPNEYQKVWEPWLSKAAVHAIAASPDGEFLAVGGGYLCDNEIHVYRWNPETLEYDRVWDSGDGILKRDVLSLDWGDTDNNHFMEIVAGSADGHIYVFEQRHIYDPITNTENQFELVWTSPNLSPVCSIKVEDVDKDYHPDILAGAWDGKVHAFEYTNRSGYPFSREHWIEYEEVWNSGNTITDKVTCITTADTDYDALPEIVAGSRNGTVYIFENNGTTLLINGYPFPLTADNRYRLLWNSSTYMWKPIQSLSAGDLDGDMADELAAVAVGQGVYVIDYDMESGKYGLNRLTRPLESWEVTKSPHTLDYYVDNMTDGRHVTYVRGGVTYTEPLSPMDSINSGLSPKNTAMAGKPDGNYTRFVPSIIIPVPPFVKFVEANATLDFGRDEEATGNGNSLPDVVVTCVAPPTAPSGFASTANFSNLKFSVSRDLTVFVDIPTSDLTCENYAGGFDVGINLDTVLAKNLWDYVRYLRIRVTSLQNYAIDAAEVKTMFRPFYTATTVTIGTLRLNSTNLVWEYLAHTLAKQGEDYEELLEKTPYQKEFDKMIVGTVEGKLYFFGYNTTTESYNLIFDSYTTSVSPGVIADWWSIKTNIWAIEEVKTSGKIPTWLNAPIFSKSLDVMMPPGKVYSSMTWADINLDGFYEAIIGTKNGTLECFSIILQHDPTQTNSYFGNVNTPWRYPGMELSAAFGQLDQTAPLEMIVGYFNATAVVGGNPAEDTFAGTDVGLDYWEYDPSTGYKWPTPLDYLEVTGNLERVLEKSVTLPKAALGDMDGDGDQDMVITNGRIYYLENIGNNTSPLFAMRPDYYASINLENLGKIFSEPQLVDFDTDGDLDLIVGYRTTSKVGATYYQNTGNAENPVWVERKWLFSNRVWNFRESNLTDPSFLYLTGAPDLVEAWEETFGTSLWMTALNVDQNKVYFFFGDTATHSRFIVGTNPKVARIEIALADGAYNNYGYHIFETWNNEDELEKWTITVAHSNLDKDAKNEVIVGDYDNNLYVFEHMVNNTYKRAFRSFDINHTVVTDESPYAWEELEGVSGNFNRTFWDHVEQLVADCDLDHNGRPEMIAAADLSLYVFEWVGNETGGGDDTYRLIWREDLRKGPWAEQLAAQNVEKITALAAHPDLDHNNYGEIIAAAGGFLFIYERSKETTFEEVYLVNGTIIGRYFLPGNPFFPKYSNLTIQAIAVGNTNSDQFNEIILGGVNRTCSCLPANGFVVVLENMVGTYRLAWTAPEEVTKRNPVNSLAIDDQDYDGKKEIIIGHDHGVDVWEHRAGSDNEYVKMEVMTSSANYPWINVNPVFNDGVNHKLYWRNTDIVQLANGTIIQVYAKDLGAFEDPMGKYRGQKTRIFIKTSNDEGETWTPERRITTDEGYGLPPDVLVQEMEPSIEVSAGGTVWIVWRTMTCEMTAEFTYSLFFGLYVTYNFGTGWIQPYRKLVSTTHTLVAYSPSIWECTPPLVVGGFNYSRGVSYLNSTDGRIHYYVYRYQWLWGAIWTYVGPLPCVGSATTYRYDASSVDMIGLRDGGYTIAFAGHYKNESKIDYDILVMNANESMYITDPPVRVTIKSTDEGCPSITQLMSDNRTLMVIFESHGGLPDETIQVSYSKNKGRNWSRPELLPSEHPSLYAFCQNGIRRYNVTIDEKVYEVIVQYSFSPSITGRNVQGFIYSVVTKVEYWKEIGLKERPDTFDDILVGVNPTSKWTKYDLDSVKTIAVGDTDRDSRREIVVGFENRAAVLEIVHTNSTIQERVQAWTSLPLTETVNDISVGDANGNGWPEIVVASARGNVYSFEVTDTTLSQASLQASEALREFNIASPSTIWALKSGNLDGDSQPDLIATDGTKVAAFKEDGTTIWDFTTPEGTVYALAIGDLDKNGIDDVFIGDEKGVVYAINGQTGTKIWNFSSPNAKPIYLVQIGDLNGDGSIDVAAGGGTASKIVYALNGTNGVQLWNVTVTKEVSGLAVGNLTGQNHMDIVAVTKDMECWVLAGNNGTVLWNFTDPLYPEYPKLERLFNPAVADLNNDTLDEVIISGCAIYALNGTTGAQIWNNTQVAGIAPSTLIGDLNVDGTPDVIAGYTWLMEGTTDVWNSTIIAVDGKTGQALWSYNVERNFVVYMATGDFNRDNITDVAAIHWDGITDQQSLVVLDGANGMVLWAFYKPLQAYSCVTAADFDLDGTCELAAGTMNGWVYIVHGVPIGVSIPVTVRVKGALWESKLHSASVSAIATGDLNGNGIDDVVSGDEEGHIYAVSGSGSEKLWDYKVSASLRCIATAHLVSEKHHDVIVGTSEGMVYAFRGDSSGEADTLWKFDAGASTRIDSIAAGNFDTDVEDEVVIGIGETTSPYGGTVQLLDDNGATIWSYTASSQVTNVRIGDINNDGKNDVVACFLNNVIALDGKTKATLWTFAVPTGPINSLEVGNFNGDGYVDVAANSLWSVHAISGRTGTELWNFTSVSASIKVGKFTTKTRDDVAVLAWASKIICINGGTGVEIWSFDNPALYTLRGLIKGDVNADGLEEVITMNWDIVYAINKRGTVWASFVASKRITGMSTGDFDGDKRVDVAIGTTDAKVYAIPG